MDHLARLIKNRSIQIFVGIALLIGCVAVLSSGSTFVKDHSLAILVVFVVIVTALDLRG